MQIINSLVDHGSPLEYAINIALSAHAGMVDKGGFAYVGHLTRVAANFLNEDFQIVAWLHDVIEDTSVELKHLTPIFDSHILDAIDAITRKPGQSWNLYIKTCNQNRIARRVKIYDIIDNLNRQRAPGNKDLESKRKMYFDALFKLNAKAEILKDVL